MRNVGDRLRPSRLTPSPLYRGMNRPVLNSKNCASSGCQWLSALGVDFGLGAGVSLRSPRGCSYEKVAWLNSNAIKQFATDFVRRKYFYL